MDPLNGLKVVEVAAGLSTVGTGMAGSLAGALLRDLGAEVVRLSAKDPVPALLEFARTHGVGHIVIDRTRKSWWRQLLGQSVMARLVREAAGFDLHIVSFEGEEESA